LEATEAERGEDWKEGHTEEAEAEVPLASKTAGAEAEEAMVENGGVGS
jgi:hypothetical protein